MATIISDPYHPWFASEIESIRQSDSLPGLIAYLGSGNGYLREAAIARSVEPAAPELLPALSARLNDWVPVVRRAAKNALLTLATRLPATDLIAQLPAVHQLRNAQREDHTEWVRQFERHLLASVGPEAIVAGIHSTAIRVARACFRVARTHGLACAGELTKPALASTDIRMASEAVGMIADLPASERYAVYSAALGSSFGAVRTAALRAMLALPHDGHEALARSCLFDPQSSVRLLAGAWLRQGGVDTAAQYVDRLREKDVDPYHIRICLLALAAGGQPEHARIMEAYADSPIPRVRMAALMGWVRLDPARKDDIAVLALGSAIPRIRKLAMVLIQDLGAYVSIDTAIAMAREQHDYRLMLRLARQAPWTWIETIACLACTPQAVQSMYAMLSQHLAEWLRSSGSIHVAPEQRQVDLLGDPAVVSTLKALQPSYGDWEQAKYIIAQLRPRPG